MKLFAAILSLSLALTAANADQAPLIKASAAVEMAEKDLESRGKYGQYFPASINLKSSGVLREETYWEILWNRSFKAEQTEGRDEIGIKVRMDGSYTRMVK